jgi:N utilization substance protein B
VSARGKARRRALDILFEADARDEDPVAVMAQHQQRRIEMGNPNLNDYTVALVTGVEDHRDEIDDLVNAVAIGWTVDRMPAVDRATLRVAVWELRYSEQVPAAVAISEAVAAARELSTDESPRFVNGVLAAIAAPAAEGQ